MTPRLRTPSLTGMKYFLLASFELSGVGLVGQIFAHRVRFENYLVSDGFTWPKLVHLSWHKAAVWVKSMLEVCREGVRHHQQYQQKGSSASLLTLSAQATQLNPSMDIWETQSSHMNNKLFCNSILLLAVTVCIDISALLHLFR